MHRLHPQLGVHVWLMSVIIVCHTGDVFEVLADHDDGNDSEDVDDADVAMIMTAGDDDHDGQADGGDDNGDDDDEDEDEDVAGGDVAGFSFPASDAAMMLPAGLK